LIAGDEHDQVSAAAADLIEDAAKAGLVLLSREDGHDLSYFDGNDQRKGHEHFGFKDGISQPAVRGRISENEFLETVRQPSDPDYTKPELAEPGQPLVCVGQFVLGYPTQVLDFPRVPGPPDQLAPKPPAIAPGSFAAPWWAANGSFLVYRRLSQDVAGFNRFVVTQASKFKGQTPLGDPLFLSSRLVGRWKSGAPILRSPLQDKPNLGSNDVANNAFEYAAGGDPGDGFGTIPVDPTGQVCPLAAHIRKVNPRDIDSDLGSSNRTLTKRILRRGIPFGRPLPDGALEDDGQERGLLFLSYQRSIILQFEFLCTDWMNSSLNPRSGLSAGGFDLLVGQNPSSPDRSRSCFLDSGNGSAVSIPTDGMSLAQFVNPTGGGYFFTPSVSALRDVLAGNS
jgi:Dyp-type peroxidase family